MLNFANAGRRSLKSFLDFAKRSACIMKCVHTLELCRSDIGSTYEDPETDPAYADIAELLSKDTLPRLCSVILTSVLVAPPVDPIVPRNMDSTLLPKLQNLTINLYDRYWIAHGDLVAAGFFDLLSLFGEVEHLELCAIFDYGSIHPPRFRYLQVQSLSILEVTGSSQFYEALCSFDSFKSLRHLRMQSAETPLVPQLTSYVEHLHVIENCKTLILVQPS